MPTLRFSRLAMAAPLALAMLGGCRIIPPAAEAPPPPPAPPMAGPVEPVPTAPAPAPVPGDTCGASLVTNYVNAVPTDAVRGDIAARVGNRAIRYYKIGDPITMDYSETRLNVELGVDGRIQRFRCG
jgi:hypothetical protein